MGTKRDQWIRGVQFDEQTLGMADAICRRRRCSRSQLVRWLIRREAASEPQIGLPGFDADAERSRSRHR